MKILIIEDEFILAAELADTLESEGYEVVATLDNGEEALDFAHSEDFDLLLCDIHIKGEMDGIETVDKLLKIKKVPVIYLTAFTDKDTLARAMDTYPAAYIPKPYQLAQLRVAIELALHNFVKENPANAGQKLSAETILQAKDSIFIKQNYQFVKLPLTELHILEADNTHTHILTFSKKYTLRLTLSQLCEKIDFPELVRIHRSYAVNIGKVDAFSEQELTILDRPLPIGPSYKDDFISRFMLR